MFFVAVLNATLSESIVIFGNIEWLMARDKNISLLVGCFDSDWNILISYLQTFMTHYDVF